MTKRIATIVVGAVFTWATVAYADQDGCVSARYRAAGKYTNCEAKAAAKSFDFRIILKCDRQLARTWGKLSKKYPASTCSDERFVDNGDGTVTDNLTLLTWERKTTEVLSGTDFADRHDVDNQYSWSASGQSADGTVFSDFLDELNSTGFAGHHDWRLPTIFELGTINNTSAGTPCIVDACVVDSLSPTQEAAYWTSSTDPSDSSQALVISYSLLASYGEQEKSTTAFVRAVRGGH